VARGELPIPHWLDLLVDRMREFSAEFGAAESRHADRERELADREAKLLLAIEAQKKETARLNEKLLSKRPTLAP